MISATRREPRAQLAWLWLIFPAIATVSIFSICLLLPQTWSWLGVVRMHPYFSDWIAILAASDAQAAGLDPYAVPSPFDPYARPHVYGPWWLHLHQLGLSMDGSAWMGLLIDIGAISAATWLLAARTSGQAFLATALIASPPLLMAYERANNDLIIFLLFVVAGLAKRGRIYHIVQAAVLGLAVMLKLYPLAALPLLAFRRSRREAITVMAVASIFILSLLYAWRRDISQAIALMPRPDTIYGFGLSVIPRYLTSLPSTTFKLTAGAGVLIGATIVAFNTRRDNTHYLAMVRTGTDGWFVVGGLCWTGCYLMNTNYPYRAVLLLLVAASWFRLWQTESPLVAWYYRNLLVAIAVMLWMHNACAHIMSITSSPAIYAGLFGMGIMQGIAFALTCVIAWALILQGRKTLDEWRSNACSPL